MDNELLQADTIFYVDFGKNAVFEHSVERDCMHGAGTFTGYNDLVSKLTVWIILYVPCISTTYTT